CGNTIKDLYGFSCPLKCSTYILQSAKTLQIVKNVSAFTTISSNVVLVAVLSSFIASWLGIILYKFTKEKI
ncbi:hypothetical protein, partial [Limosilactobacillus ingluviei]|uniref:hypothetical protein n=1 Tax=Limosilactobacillus ingluviei TaxID=148604 RepID=UPI0024B8C457